ncbi:MAG: hypothetical protein AB4058_15895 [Microcystaceae cyanobacterium]
MNRNEFEELEALERRLQEVERQLLELREDKKKLEDRLISDDTPDELIIAAQEADQLIESKSFKEKFCQLYSRLLTEKVVVGVDITNLASLITTLTFGMSVPVLNAGFSIIGVSRRLLDKYCQEFTYKSQKTNK